MAEPFTQDMEDTNTILRCEWAGNDPLYQSYHDNEWGVPVRDDAKMFEFLILETFQAGLSWITILRKRENFRSAFDEFDPQKVAEFGDDKIEQLMQNAGIVRNRAKIVAAVSNAKAYISIQREFGSFCNYLWAFTDGKSVVSHFEKLSQLPAKTDLSNRISADLKARGFKFVGSTVIYAHLQATGIVNDHLTHCFRHPDHK